MRRDRIFIRKRNCAGLFCISTRDSSTKRSRLSGKCSRRRAIGGDAPMPSRGSNGSAFTKPTRLLCGTAAQKASRTSCGKKAIFTKRRKQTARVHLGPKASRWESSLNSRESRDWLLGQFAPAVRSFEGCQSHLL